ncbi:hypothetical protein BBBOND_0309150 [Babesia bigemina]|uniref:Extracellular matrix-binding ebh n=1 Tax=Babesia bigemina TaxID=5866 RepID=A0A061DAK4_BABBI|nr:hypothetical protein BBBOND_0309150 [Babesia bigemina]CDR97012.1 hypothetical protein BBBOND_0309150 [Babesia bigemina]|eukprot:XP_012769198.1 hypothetical protein BBBOND_0309150 [Babesia bigemina]
MAPKALTECPENLREAIDWLVQVRHCSGVSTLSGALSALFDNAAQDAEKSLPSLLDTDRPSARDVVSKLRAFQSTLPKDSENPNKNIIHNLCASACSFLGYRYRGTYDGSGIVYGNASRLCDAILALLYAVFSDVCDNQPYVAGRSVLHDVIVQLKSQLWRGHKGFCQAIPKVATGLQRYNAAVEASNERVKEPIQTVLEYVKPDGELCRGINILQITETSTSAEDEKAVESAVSLVEGCKEVARVLSKSLMAAKDAINDLNPKLKKKLENARRSFFNHVDWLSRWSKKGQKKMLDKMIQKIKNRLKQLANAVKDKIKQEVHTVVELLKDRVREVKMKLEGITVSLEEYVKELGQWMDEAKEYIQDVKKYVNKIMQELDGENRKAIDKAAADIDSELSEKVEELNQWIETADAAVNVAKDKADDVFKRLDKDEKSGTKISQGFEKISEAKENVSEVSTQLLSVHDDLVGWKDATQGVISKAAGKAGEVSGQLDPSQKGDGNPIGKNLKDIETAEKTISSANEQLKSQVDKLSKWITEADKIREQAQKKAQEVYNSLDVHKDLSEKLGQIKTANQEIKSVNKELSEVDKNLEEWKQVAGKVIQDVVKKAEDVYKKLDHGDKQQLISQGITQINAAKDNVDGVAKGLTSVNEDLQKWREAAKAVLGTVIDKASEVHKQLNPDAHDASHPIGQKIKEIGDAKQEIDKANQTLGQQVKLLNTWINEAESIRAAAESKAKEAYDKLSVHEELSKNVNRIMDASKAIKGVNNAVEKKLKELGTWNEKAKEVLDGAIIKAQEVHGKLQDAVVEKIDEIEQHNKEIITANNSLEKEVGHLGKWRAAAGKVIDQADEKCDKILEKVQNEHPKNYDKGNKTVIFQQAEDLKNQGKRLLDAAKNAKQRVEKNVKSALEAVNEMDSDLKKDLFDVKTKIKQGITEVISTLQVNKLGERVREDLVKLRERIGNLKGKVNKNEKNGGTLVKKELDALDQAKNTLTEESRKIKEQKLKEMDQRFNSAIKESLNQEVEKVTTAIQTLYGKINPKNDSASETDKKQLHKIFEHINNEVEKIKGKAGSSASDPIAKGLDGIVSKTKGLVRGFGDRNKSGHGFSQRVDGWIGNILGINQNTGGKQIKGMEAVISWIKEYDSRVNERNNALKDQFKQKIKEALNEQITAGQDKISLRDVKESIVENLTKVKEACDTFADALDAKLTKVEIEKTIAPIVRNIQGSSGGAGTSGGNAEHLTTAVKTALIALCRCVKQVASEIDFLGVRMFGGIIDETKKTVDGLNTNLTNAAKTGTPAIGTAQAVDNAIDKVREEVKGLEQKFEQVKKPVEEAVRDLDTAVDTFDKQAQQQVKDAAEGAIKAAAKEISNSDNVDLDEALSKMQNFHEAHQKINDELPTQLESLLNEHIGRDGKVGGGDTVSLKHTLSLGAYRKHIKQNGGDEGKLKQAIERIRDGVDDALKMADPSVKKTIEELTFNSAFALIASELLGITHLVNGTNSFVDGGEQGVKALLTELHKGIGKNKLADTEKGLEAIIEAIRDMQKEAFGTKPKAIEKIATDIKAQVEDLKKKLKSGDKDPIINALKDLKDAGLASGQWNGNDGRQVDGLLRIYEDLQMQSGKVPDQTGIIGEAIKKIRWELLKLGYKLDNLFTDDDILDKLKELQRKIGKDAHIDGDNLRAICSIIEKLQNGQLTRQPTVIEGAQEVIAKELERLQGELRNGNGNGVINAIENLRDIGLSENTWVKAEHNKGLQLIENELKEQQESLAQQPGQFNSGVEKIITMIAKLRKELIDGNSGKDGVIDVLVRLKDNGLTEGEWEETGIHGLGLIQKEVTKQNKKLSNANKIIDKATDSVLSYTQSVLKTAKQKLRDDIATDDVLDNLEELQKKIGLIGSNDDATLRGIYKKISGLQEDAFTNNPKEIEEAKIAINKELEEQRATLQKNVTDPLKDLVTNGFGKSDKWNGNAKGFDNIQKRLNTQNDTLSQQPQNIQDGINEITDELKSLRAVLQGTGDDNPEKRGVIKNLEHLRTQIGNKDNKGLKKIKSEIDSLNKNQIPVITQNLNTMSTEITNAAGQLGLNLIQLGDPHIDVKLKDIQDGFDNLRLTDLAEAIRLCDDFLNKADEMEKNTIIALLKHVDDDVYDAIKDLTKEARTLYVDSVKEALELFVKKVEEDLEQLPNEINRERYIGYKGFMKYLQGSLTSDLTGDEQSVAELSSAFQEVFEQMEKYIRVEITRLHDEQKKEQNPSLPPTEEPYTPKLNDVYEALTALLAYLRDNDDGADKLTELVERLTKALGDFVPSDFKHLCTPLLDTVSRGLTKFAAEFGNTYLSTYSGQRCREEHSHKYAKVFLSLIPMTHKALNKLMMKCEGEWKHLPISMFTAGDRDNALGNYLTRCGYRVSSSRGEQDGELNNVFTGGGIYELLFTPIESVDIEMMIDGDPMKNGINFVQIISLLYNLLCRYFQVCHIPVPPEPRYPCTVRDMLSWLSGLQYTMVADKLPGHCKALLNRRCHDGDTPNKEDPIMAKCIGELPIIIASACSHSTALLTAIQGNGHGFDLAAYPYSVDFSNNRARLHYPADPDALLEMLRDITCRLSKVLYFLYSQCCRSTARVKGWRECAYGRQVQSNHWQCKQIGTYPSTISTTTAATTTTSSTSNPGCPPTSPLQSFLSDHCQGLLPHTLTAADMTIQCANCAANQPGQQCLTPLGFWDLGFAASISGTGWDLAKRLGDMCRDADSCLFVLCRTLFLLCPTAPSSLADMFSLFTQVLRRWDSHDRVQHRGGTYTDASDFISHLNTDGIDSLFPLWKELHGSYENHKLTSAIASLAGHDHISHDALSNLFNDFTCKSPSGCAPYLQPLGLHARHTYPQKHARLYITWIMYMAWQFWELLFDLLQALDNIDCTASGCATCPCKPGIHGGKDTCHCPSIVHCAGPLPTLYRHGFTYRNANLLVTDNRAMRCGDLNAQLKRALHSDHFTELFRQIDQLMWHIRMPFFYCFIALWSLVALYILHTSLYRMDVLRIRSHLLTTKASHLIDVKALLIPSRKMLSLYNASYFDDDPNELLNLK